MTKYKELIESLNSESQFELLSVEEAFGELTVTCNLESIHSFLKELKRSNKYRFDQLMDLCVVDYLYFGAADWETNVATETGFSRAVEKSFPELTDNKKRFAVVYHLLSTVKNLRIRVKVFCSDGKNIVHSAHDIWKSANWFEREAYDLYGILFTGHPDLRRILTDYGFIGHPFRKDFPLSGHVEMRYDANLQKVIYEPVDIEPRILEPKVIRCDNRNHD